MPNAGAVTHSDMPLLRQVRCTPHVTAHQNMVLAVQLQNVTTHQNIVLAVQLQLQMVSDFKDAVLGDSSGATVLVV